MISRRKALTLLGLGTSTVAYSTNQVTPPNSDSLPSDLLKMLGLHKRRFTESASSMKALDVYPGTTIQTQGRAFPGDGGAAQYLVKTKVKAEADGNIIDEEGAGFTLNNGYVATLQQEGLLELRLFCPPNNSKSVQSAINYLNITKGNKSLDGGCLPLIFSTGAVHSSGNSNILNLSVTASGDFNSVNTEQFILKSSQGLRMDYENIRVNCSGVANGIWNATKGFYSHYKNIEVYSFRNDGYGIKIQGASDQRLTESMITGTPEASQRGTGVGVHIDAGDFKLSESIIRYANIPLRVSQNTLLATGNHFYNGSAGSKTNATNSINILVDGGSGQSFCHNYIDKGRIFLKDSFSVAFFDTKLLFNSKPQHDSVFVLYTSKEQTAFPDSFIYDGCQSTKPLNKGKILFSTLESGRGGSWDNEARSINDEINLRYSGYPRIVAQETCQVVSPNRTIICKGDTQTEKHSLASLSYAENTMRAPEEVWKPQYHSISAENIISAIKSKGQTTSAQIEIEGSRNSTNSAAAIVLKNRRGKHSWKDAQGSFWKIGIRTRANNSSDDLVFSIKSSLETTPRALFTFSKAEKSFYCIEDEGVSLGKGGNYWSVIYTSTSSIVSADHDDKQDIRDLEENEKKAALKIKKLIKAYRFKKSVHAKGDDARIHFGVIAQDIRQAFIDSGLNPDQYALFCKDEWPDQYDHIIEKEAVHDEWGTEISPAITRKVLIKPAGYKYGVRYDELFSFIIASL